MRRLNLISWSPHQFSLIPVSLHGLWSWVRGSIEMSTFNDIELFFKSQWLRGNLYVSVYIFRVSDSNVQLWDEKVPLSHAQHRGGSLMELALREIVELRPRSNRTWLDSSCPQTNCQLSQQHPAIIKMIQDERVTQNLHLLLSTDKVVICLWSHKLVLVNYWFLCMLWLRQISFL